MTAFTKKRPTRRLSLSDIPDFDALLSDDEGDDKLKASAAEGKNSSKMLKSKTTSKKKRNSTGDKQKQQQPKPKLTSSSSNPNLHDSCPSLHFDLMQDSVESFAFESSSEFDKAWKQEQAEEAARRVRESKCSRRGQRTLLVSSSGSSVATSMEITVLNPVREKIKPKNGMSSNNGSNHSSTSKGSKSKSSDGPASNSSSSTIPPRLSSKSKSKSRGSNHGPPSTRKVWPSSNNSSHNKKADEEFEYRMHQSCSRLSEMDSSHNTTSTRNSSSSSQRKKSQDRDRLSSSDHGPSFRKVMKATTGDNNPKSSSNGRHGSSSKRRASVRLEPSKRDVAAQKALEKGITIERLSSSAHANLTASPGVRTVSTAGSNSTHNTPTPSSEHRRRSTGTTRRGRRSVEPPILRTSKTSSSPGPTRSTGSNHSNGGERRRKKSRSRSRGRRLSTAQQKMLGPGEKPFVLDQSTASTPTGTLKRSTRSGSRGASANANNTPRSKRSSLSRESLALLSPGERPFVPDERPSSKTNTPRASTEAGNNHQAERRRRRRSSTGRDAHALVMALAKSCAANSSNNYNSSSDAASAEDKDKAAMLLMSPKEKALMVLSPAGRDKAAVWEKRAAASRILRMDESKPAISAPPLAV